MTSCLSVKKIHNYCIALVKQYLEPLVVSVERSNAFCYKYQDNVQIKQFTVLSVEFLHTVTEDNTELRRPELLPCVQRLMSEPINCSYDLLTRSLATGNIQQ